MTPNNWGKPELKAKQPCSPPLGKRSFSMHPSEPRSRHPQAFEQRDTYKPPLSSICRGPWRTRICCKGRAGSECPALLQALLMVWGDFSPQQG